MTTPTSHHVDQTLAFIQEARERRLQFFADALANPLTSLEPRGLTTHKCRCDICGTMQEKGVQKYFFKTPNMFRGEQCGWESYEVHPCPVCAEVLKIQPAEELIELER